VGFLDGIPRGGDEVFDGCNFLMRVHVRGLF
jgi:hypothetical protein